MRLCRGCLLSTLPVIFRKCFLACLGLSHRALVSSPRLSASRTPPVVGPFQRPVFAIDGRRACREYAPSMERAETASTHGSEVPMNRGSANLFRHHRIFAADRPATESPRI